MMSDKAKRKALRRQRRKAHHKKILAEIQNANTIPYPEDNSEFEVQAELYKELSNWYDVRGCVRARCRDGCYAPRVFLDLVIFVDRKAKVIIECKNDESEGFELKPGTRQHDRYTCFGVPVLKCSSLAAIEPVILKVDEITDRVRRENAELLHELNTGEGNPVFAAHYER